MTILEDRMKGFTVNTYIDVPLIPDSSIKDYGNREARRLAIWVIRHPNKMMPTQKLARELALPWLIPQKVELIPEKEEEE